jgi:DNA mismatch repair protein MutS2
VNKLETEKKEILRKTKVEAELYLKDVNKKIESAIKNIKESQAEKSTVKFEKQKIEEIKNHVKEIVKKTEEKKTKFSDKVLKIGDTVKITGTETIGELIELDGDRAILLSGSIKVLSKLNKLEFTSHKSIERTARNEYTIGPQIESLRLDIRGKKPEEVEFEIIRYIDDAYSNDLQNIEILHGKGNGVLKKLVHELLKKHEAVKNYYFAQIEFGGEGITIVELK